MDEHDDGQENNEHDDGEENNSEISNEDYISQVWKWNFSLKELCGDKSCISWREE